jgi:hypothetical protein
MNSTAKVLIPNKEWLVRDEKSKIGSISKSKKGYIFLKNGQQVKFKDLNEINTQFGIAIFEESIKKIKAEKNENQGFLIYDYPCKSEPFDPVYDVKKKLPLFAKSPKSKSRYCAGYYVIQFKKVWLKSYCPKLITLERNPYQGPFRTPQEMKAVLNRLNKV